MNNDEIINGINYSVTPCCYCVRKKKIKQGNDRGAVVFDDWQLIRNKQQRQYVYGKRTKILPSVRYITSNFRPRNIVKSRLLLTTVRT